MLKIDPTTRTILTPKLIRETSADGLFVRYQLADTQNESFDHFFEANSLLLLERANTRIMFTLLYFPKALGGGQVNYIEKKAQQLLTVAPLLRERIAVVTYGASVFYISTARILASMQTLIGAKQAKDIAIEIFSSEADAMVYLNRQAELLL